MSEISSVESYSDAGSLSDSSSRHLPPPPSRLSVGETSSLPSSSISSGTQKEEELTDTTFLLRAFDQFDQKSERFDDDIDAPLSPEEQRLMREIEMEQEADDELERDVTTRAALLTSPLLMAASFEVVTARDAIDSSFYPQEASNAQPSSLMGEYKGEESGGDRDSDLDGEINEDDLQFGSKESDSNPPSLEPATSEYIDPFIEQEDERLAAKARNDRQRKLFFGIGWTIAIALIIAVIVVYTTRDNNNQRNLPTTPPTPRPTRMPTISPQPTISPRPTRTPTLRPTSEPSRRERTRAPSIPPIPLTLPPTRPPTPAQQTPAPTPRPTQQTSAPTPTTMPPIPLRTLPPTDVAAPPSLAPTLSRDEVERRADIVEFVITVSGLLAISDNISPQFLALQWILNDDPLQLLVTDTPEFSQRYYLAVLYYATEGDAWDDCGPPTGDTPCTSVFQRFLSGSPECMWLGVTCDASQEIESISIRDNGLGGQLPPELGELSQLSNLSFVANSLGGTIPSHLARLSRLRFLILTNNRYTGRIPTHLGKLNSIWFLHLGNNRFSGQIPPEIFTPSMQDFDVGDNELVGTIPSALYTVSENLRNIRLSDNRLTGTLPRGLGDYPALSSFSGENNLLTGTLPGEIVSDTLQTLDVGTNQLRGQLPPEMYMFGTSLKFVNLGFNNFDGTISTSFGDLRKLETLVFYFNDMTGTVPAELGRLTNLQVLHFARTNLQGTMPSAICGLREGKLQVLSSDCGGANPVFECNCCTVCIDGNRRNRHLLRATAFHDYLFEEPSQMLLL